MRAWVDACGAGQDLQNFTEFSWLDYSGLGFRISLGVWGHGYFVILLAWDDTSFFNRRRGAALEF
jgi:hypothetical protein